MGLAKRYRWMSRVSGAYQYALSPLPSTLPGQQNVLPLKAASVMSPPEHASTSIDCRCGIHKTTASKFRIRLAMLQR